KPKSYPPVYPPLSSRLSSSRRATGSVLSPLDHQLWESFRKFEHVSDNEKKGEKNQGSPESCLEWVGTVWVKLVYEGLRHTPRRRAPSASDYHATTIHNWTGRGPARHADLESPEALPSRSRTRATPHRSQSRNLRRRAGGRARRRTQSRLHPRGG